MKLLNNFFYFFKINKKIRHIDELLIILLTFMENK